MTMTRYEKAYNAMLKLYSKCIDPIGDFIDTDFLVELYCELNDVLPTAHVIQAAEDIAGNYQLNGGHIENL